MKYNLLKIKEIREKKNYSQEYLAARLNISQQSYSRLERNVHRVPIYRLYDIAEILEVEVFELFDTDTTSVQFSSLACKSHREDEACEAFLKKIAIVEEEIAEIKSYFIKIIRSELK